MQVLNIRWEIKKARILNSRFGILLATTIISTQGIIKYEWPVHYSIGFFISDEIMKCKLKNYINGESSWAGWALTHCLAHLNPTLQSS